MSQIVINSLVFWLMYWIDMITNCVERRQLCGWIHTLKSWDYNYLWSQSHIVTKCLENNNKSGHWSRVDSDFPCQNLAVLRNNLGHWILHGKNYKKIDNDIFAFLGTDFACWKTNRRQPSFSCPKIRRNRRYRALETVENRRQPSFSCPRKENWNRLETVEIKSATT